MFEILNPIGDIEYIVNEYKKTIDFFSKYRYEDQIEKQEKIETKNELVNMCLRMEYQNYCTELFAINEEIEKMSDNELDEFLLTNSIYDRIKTKNELTKSEIRQKFKNCLAHADFLICYDRNNPTQMPEYYFNNKFIEGHIPPYFISSLLIKYKQVDKDERIYLINDNGIIKTENDLIRFIKSLTCISFEKKENTSGGKAKINIDNNCFKHIKDKSYIKEKALELTEEDKYDVTVKYQKINYTSDQIKIITDLILYNGISNFNKLDYSSKIVTITSLFRNQKDKVQNYNIYIKDFIMSKDRVYTSSERMLFPIIYCNAVEELLGYTMCYLREINEKTNGKLFELKNFDYSGIKCLDSNGEIVDLYEYLKNKKVIKETDPLINLKERIKLSTKALDKLEEEKESKEKLFEQINNINDKRPEELKEKIRKSCQDFFDEYEKKWKEEINILNGLKDELKQKEELPEFKKYINSRDFFRHIRNSISHGNIEINLKSLRTNKDLSQIIFKLTDGKTGKDDYFEISMTCKELLSLINIYKDSILKEIDENALQTAFYYSDKKKTKKIKTSFEGEKEIQIQTFEEMNNNPIISSILMNSSFNEKKNISYMEVIKSTYNSKMKDIKKFLFLYNYCVKRSKEITLECYKKGIEPPTYKELLIQIHKEWIELNNQAKNIVLHERIKQSLK